LTFFDKNNQLAASNKEEVKQAPPPLSIPSGEVLSPVGTVSDEYLESIEPLRKSNVELMVEAHQLSVSGKNRSVLMNKGQPISLIPAPRRYTVHHNQA